MKTGKLFYTLLSLFLLLPVQAQDDVDLFDFWKYYSDIENSLYKHFCSVTFEQLESRRMEINGISTKAEWMERQAWTRQKFSEIAGPFPERTPLNAVVKGKLKRDGYHIEKILYESVPGYYVTGALYIPDGIRKKAPAVFYAWRPQIPVCPGAPSRRTGNPPVFSIGFAPPSN